MTNTPTPTVTPTPCVDIIIGFSPAGGPFPDQTKITNNSSFTISVEGYGNFAPISYTLTPGQFTSYNYIAWPYTKACVSPGFTCCECYNTQTYAQISCPSPTPTPSPTSTPNASPTQTPSNTPTQTPSNSPLITRYYEVQATGEMCTNFAPWVVISTTTLITNFATTYCGYYGGGPIDWWNVRATSSTTPYTYMVFNGQSGNCATLNCV
jgi:hypothetical protein